MGDTLDDIYWERQARAQTEAREFEDRTILRTRQRKEYLAKLLQGDDMSAWLAPTEGAPSDEVLSEHMAQLRNVVRYAMQFALADDMSIETNLAAAAATTRMIRANVALAKALKTSEPTNSKTVHGGRKRKDPPD